MKRAFSLTELVVAVVIITILILIAYPLYKTAKERALDKEAILGLKRIQAAERAYKQDTLTISQMQTNCSACPGGNPPCYYPCGSTETDINNINDALQLDIPLGPSRNWACSVNTTAATFVRMGGTSRSWSLNYSGIDEEPTCTNQTGPGVKCPW